jgi:peptide/nickel transport system permease protein
MVPTLLGVVLLVFFLFKFFGGDPSRDPGRPERHARADQAIRQQLGLDQPACGCSCGIFLKQIVTFDWGKSWATNEAVSNLFATRMPATLTVMLPILMLDVLLALPIAMGWPMCAAALTDRTLMVATTVALSISFLVYVIVGQYVFGFQLGWFPVQGWSDSVWTNLLHLRAAAGAAGGDGGRGAADAAVPQLLPRRAGPRLRAHRARQGPDRAARCCSSMCCATR